MTDLPGDCFVLCTSTTGKQWRFHAGAGGAQALQIVASPQNLVGSLIVARPPNLAVLLTHCGHLILRKKLVNLMPPDVMSDYKG